MVDSFAPRLAGGPNLDVFGRAVRLRFDDREVSSAGRQPYGYVYDHPRYAADRNSSVTLAEPLRIWLIGSQSRQKDRASMHLL
jgi:hypothetical protein